MMLPIRRVQSQADERRGGLPSGSGETWLVTVQPRRLDVNIMPIINACAHISRVPPEGVDLCDGRRRSSGHSFFLSAERHRVEHQYNRYTKISNPSMSICIDVSKSLLIVLR